jgi:hypothetical protein
LLGRKANLLLHWAMSVCVRGLVALYGTLPEARDECVRPLGRQVPVGPRARTGRKAGPGNGLRTVAWTPSVDGSVTAKLGSCAEGCKFVWLRGLTGLVQRCCAHNLGREILELARSLTRENAQSRVSAADPRSGRGWLGTPRATTEQFWADLTVC